MYKMMKVFDCQNGMPENIKKVFFELYIETENNMYKMMKVFDCQNGMPENIKKVFFELYPDPGNDCWVSREVMSETYLDEADDSTETELPYDEHTILDAWLLENGARVGEYVLINHWG